MSTRLGMADERCFTTYIPNCYLNDSIARQVGVNIQDGHAYRKFLQENTDTLIAQFSIPSKDCIKVREPQNTG
jgi:hypothetical protein